MREPGIVEQSTLEPSQQSVSARLRADEPLAELGCVGEEHELEQAGELALPAVAYILPGLPPEGSGGSHSLTQEARGQRALGARSRVCVPAAALATVTSLYGNEDGLFVPYARAADVMRAIGDADVVVATEHPSIDMLTRVAHERPQVLCAYYVQDYEPLFAPAGTARADRALLSYRANPDQLLFAKTHWLRNVVGALHGVAVAKVAPSLDGALFHADARIPSQGPVRIAAMLRPRTPRRRPVATLAILRSIRQSLGDAVEIVTFGCDEEAFAGLGAGVFAGLSHLGLLERREVAALMRRCDVFIDGSAYQAFGRTGLEAMSCGAVPVLPALGGVHEYAVDGENAVIVSDDSAAIDAVRGLVSDPARLRALSEAGVRRARDFSIERAARSQLELFAVELRRRARSTMLSS